MKKNNLIYASLKGEKLRYYATLYYISRICGFWMIDEEPEKTFLLMQKAFPNLNKKMFNEILSDLHRNGILGRIKDREIYFNGLGFSKMSFQEMEAKLNTYHS